jgi:flagellar basal body-associated protein FliL
MADENTNAPEGAEAAAASGTGEGKKKKLTPLMMGLFAQLGMLLVAVGLMIHAIYMIPKPKLDRKTLEDRVVASIHDDRESIRQMDLAEIVVNLSPETSMRTKLTIEVSNEEVLEALKKREIMIKARAWRILSAFPHDKLLRVHGKLQLKDKLIEALIDELEKSQYKGAGTVREVYLVDMIRT